MMRKNVVLTGMVQGVGFRFSAQRKAQELHITGWVRNRDDGAVEAEIQGTEEQVDEMLRWLREGPRGAEVGSFEVTDAAELGSEKSFAIRR